MAIQLRDDIDLNGSEVLNANLGSLDQHSNVDLTGVSINDTLIWNGTHFEVGTAGAVLQEDFTKMFLLMGA